MPGAMPTTTKLAGSPRLTPGSKAPSSELLVRGGNSPSGLLGSWGHRKTKPNRGKLPTTKLAGSPHLTPGSKAPLSKLLGRGGNSPSCLLGSWGHRKKATEAGHEPPAKTTKTDGKPPMEREALPPPTNRKNRSAFDQERKRATREDVSPASMAAAPSAKQEKTRK